MTVRRNICIWNGHEVVGIGIGKGRQRTNRSHHGTHPMAEIHACPWVSWAWYYTLHHSEASLLLQRTGKWDFSNRFISKWVQHINLGCTCMIRSHWFLVCRSIFIPFTSVHLLLRPDNPLSQWTIVNFSLSYWIIISKSMWEVIMTHPSPSTWALSCTKCDIRM